MDSTSCSSPSSAACHKKPLLRSDPSLQTQTVCALSVHWEKVRVHTLPSPRPQFPLEGALCSRSREELQPSPARPCLGWLRQDCRNQRGTPAPGDISQVPTQAYFTTILYQSKVLPSLRFSPQKTRVQKSFYLKPGHRQQQSQNTVLMLLTRCLANSQHSPPFHRNSSQIVQMLSCI